LCVFHSSFVQPSACEVEQMNGVMTQTRYVWRTKLTNTITMSLSLITLPVSCPESARPINAGSRTST